MLFRYGRHQLIFRLLLAAWLSNEVACGVLRGNSNSNIKPRIVGGQDAELSSYAMHLTMNNETQQWEFAGCGGTLISNCHVLTAAHCLTYPRTGVTEALYINAWRPFQNNSNGTISKPFHLSRILPHLTKVHERFSNRDNANDIAILTMETCTDDFPVMELADASFMKSLADAESILRFFTIVHGI